MDPFHYRKGLLYCEDISLDMIAKKYGTPCYVYSKNAIRDNYLAHKQAFGTREHLIAYAVKANSNLAILQLLASLGSGFDIVSGGELLRVLAAGGDPRKIVFSGVAKTSEEIALALTHNIFCFNVESIPEIIRINDLAKGLGKTAPVSIRINPDIDARSHPYMSTGLKENKFGLSLKSAMETLELAKNLPHIQILGIDYHIGSQVTSLSPFSSAFQCIERFIQKLEKKGFSFSHIDVGGGLGITYQEERPPTPEEWVHSLLFCAKGRKETLIIEPGRSIVGNAGILLTRVEYLKKSEERTFAIVDAGMNDLLRPALYQAWHDINPVNESSSKEICMDVVGPVCESSDTFGKDRMIAAQEKDLLAIRDVGAYGFPMASNYNTRPRPAEVWVDEGTSSLIRRRETLESLFAGELDLIRNQSAHQR